MALIYKRKRGGNPANGENEIKYSNFSKRRITSRVIYPAKLSFRYEREIKVFPDIQRLKDLPPEDPPIGKYSRVLFYLKQRTEVTKL